MNPTDNIKKAIKEMILPGTKTADDRILNDALSTFEQAGPYKSTRINPQIRIWIKRTVAAIIVFSILIPLTYGASRIIRKLMIKPAWRGQFVRDFKLDKDIHFDLRIGTKEEPEIVLGRNIRFFVEEGQLFGTLRSNVRSWPKFKWRTTIELVDDIGNSIASAEQIRENGGIKYTGYRREFDHNIHFSLGPWDDVLQEQVKKISVKYEQVSEDIAITPDAWIESSKLGVVHGQITDADGRPVPNAWIRIGDKRRKGQRYAGSRDVCTDGRGFYIFDEIRGPYLVRVTVYNEDPAGQDYFFQYIRLNRTLHGTQKIDFKFEEFPHGTAVLKGRIVKPDGSTATEFTVDVRNEVDWKDYSEQYLHQFGFKKYFVTSDGRFEISGLASGKSSIGINLTGKEFESIEINLKYTWQVCQLINGKITEITNETAVKKVVKPVLDERVQYYGRVLYENGKPAVPPTSPWEGAKVYVQLRSTPATSLGVEGIVDDQGYFAILLTDEQFEKITTGEYSIKIYYPSCQDEFTSYTIGTFPVEMLTQNLDNSKGYRLPPDGMSVEFKNLEQILKSYDVLHELGSVLLKWCDRHNDRFPDSLNLNEVVSFADAETLTWIKENVEYQAGGRTGHEAEIFPVAYDKTLLEKINGTHVLFSNGDVKFLRRREVEIIDSY
ncbi:MAG: hypothetical protein GWN67_17015 [Phycisphaerae bacterium]|nr:carboxypeptidase regulatory-like domain-containing protein [Phycisphaerae bacterium]NIR67510.1 carboxypeptidase regulatory-like domain-containing protein [candidate division Zixibacteria bacterium]NIP51797.1 carboxypeptidase regulatory-like domain-containing protein [Phycisphaerae bacterium]NIS50929.1 carboxypeptidase regulatory-like domain-containing protein [Phycisphaerae bacterium]NIU10322.1 carboxypeptidase regulatory-like domain-containing protein [Phycisphaerae bacterium]